MQPSFLEAFKPILKVNQYLGIITFSVTQTKIICYSKIRCAVNIIVVLLFIPLVIKIWHGLFILNKNAIIKTTDILLMVGAPCYTIFIWIYSTINQKNCAAILMKIIQFDAKLQHSFAYGRQNKRIIKHMAIRFANIIATSVYASWYTYMVIPDDDAYTLLEDFVYSFTYVLSSAFCHQVAELIYTIKLRFEVLNERILQLKKSKLNVIADDRLLKLRNICAMHHELSKLVKLISETFGSVLLFFFGFTFVSCVVSLFYVSSEMQQDQVDQNMITGIVACFSVSSCFIFDAVYLCNICYSTIEEANKSGELIHKIRTDDNDTKVEIAMFSLQIANEQLEINAAGFFPINYTLLLSIVGGATTYVLILIQLAASINFRQHE